MWTHWCWKLISPRTIFLGQKDCKYWKGQHVTRRSAFDEWVCSFAFFPSSCEPTHFTARFAFSFSLCLALFLSASLIKSKFSYPGRAADKKARGIKCFSGQLLPTHINPVVAAPRFNCSIVHVIMHHVCLFIKTVINTFGWGQPVCFDLSNMELLHPILIYNHHRKTYRGTQLATEGRFSD